MKASIFLIAVSICILACSTVDTEEVYFDPGRYKDFKYVYNDTIINSDSDTCYLDFKQVFNGESALVLDTKDLGGITNLTATVFEMIDGNWAQTIPPVNPGMKRGQRFRYKDHSEGGINGERYMIIIKGRGTQKTAYKLEFLGKNTQE